MKRVERAYNALSKQLKSPAQKNKYFFGMSSLCLPRNHFVWVKIWPFHPSFSGPYPPSWPLRWYIDINSVKCLYPWQQGSIKPFRLLSELWPPWQSISIILRRRMQRNALTSAPMRRNVDMTYFALPVTAPLVYYCIQNVPLWMTNSLTTACLNVHVTPTIFCI